MNDSTGALTAQGYDFLPTNMNLNPALSKYTSFSVSKDQFVVQYEARMLYYKCTMTDYVNYKCDLKSTVQLDSTKKWDQHKRNMNYNDLNFVWICNDTDCFALLFNYTTLQYKLVFLTSD